jgi:tagatose-6-phosphate ketose/aldose isomerase
MTKLLDRTRDEWHRFEGLSTAEEIAQQPQVWRELAHSLGQQQARIAAFLHGFLGQAEHRVILTGAGSSAFAGEAIAEEINRSWPAQVRAIATTSLITHPELYLERDKPTLLVSFARSGNSPESLAAVNLVRTQVEQARFLNITCNPAGELFARNSAQADTLNLLMPPASCDRGFAMTSSFTSMQLAALAAFSREPWELLLQRLDRLAAQADALLADWSAPLAALAQQPFERIVYLGSGPLEALAKEAALKVLELSSGRVAAFANTSLGFRHGPKSVLDKSTLVLLFLSNEENARRYELDLLAELRRDQVAARILAIGPGQPADAGTGSAAGGADGDRADLLLPDMALNDSWLAPLWLLAAQQYALHRSVALGLTPDNPFPDGTVNRIVQGVTIYPYAGR